MSDNAIPTSFDVGQLIQNLREQVGQRSEKSLESRVRTELTNSLHSIDDEIEALNSEITNGEISPRSAGLRDRIGSLLKRRLYRLLWWQTHQTKALAALTLRRGREETKLVDALSQSIIESNRRADEGENRLRQLESAQLRLQSSEIERNVRHRVAELQKERDLVRQELNEVKNALGLAESTQGQKIAELTQLLETETKQKEAMAVRLSDLAQRVETEAGQKEAIGVRLSELAQRVETETGQKEAIAVRLSELGLFTHQTRATLSIQDRRLSLFIEEARKRLPGPFTDNQLHDLIKNYTDHKYDSLYVAFEDVFRGNRQEIKTRQSVYLPFLKEHGIGSVAMPIVDLGCGRGEWLELLGEHGLEATGIDRNEKMIEQCNLAGLKVMQGDALSYLGTLADSCLGAVTSFHMVEHFPFEVTIGLVDEILRVLKPGGIIILETPNPQNILVGASTFYLDPTHLKPLPSPMLRFFVEARGFCDAQVWELQPYPESVRLPEDGKGIASRLNDYLYGPQDYAVIGRKA